MGSSQVGHCREVLQQVWIYLDAEADGATAAELDAHLAECEPCLRAFEFDRRFKSLVTRCCSSAPVDAGRIEKLRSRLQAVLEERRRSTTG